MNASTKGPLGFAKSLLVVLGLALAAAGCGSSASSLCNDFCDCSGCSDVELDDCIDDVEDAEKTADDEGCSDQYGEYADCISSEFECRESEVDIDGCESEARSLNECLR